MRGLSAARLAALERDQPAPLADAYRQFMALAGGGAGRFMRDGNEPVRVAAHFTGWLTAEAASTVATVARLREWYQTEGPRIARVSPRSAR